MLDGVSEAGVECKAIIDKTRPTTNKNAIIAGGYRLLKIDTLDNSSISKSIIGKLVKQIEDTPTDAVVFSDFRHGIYNALSVPKLTEAIPNDVYRVADSQVASRWGNITEFVGFDLITPNEREARFSLADQDSTVRNLSLKLMEETECNTVFLKLGSRGVFVSYQDETKGECFLTIDSFAGNVVDAVGAGDAMLAYSTLCMMATGSRYISSIVGSMAAACECEYDGNIPIRPDDVLRKIDAVERLANYS